MKREQCIAGLITLFLLFSIVPLAHAAEESQLVQDSEFDMQPAQQWKEYYSMTEPLYSLSFKDGLAQITLGSGTKSSGPSYQYGMYQSITVPSSTENIQITVKNGNVLNAETWKERLEFWYSKTYWSIDLNPVSGARYTVTLNESNAQNLFENLGKELYFIVELYFPSKPGTASYELDVNYAYVNVTTLSQSTESLIQDPNFQSDLQYWSYTEQGPEQWSVSFQNGLAVISGPSTSSITAQNPASCLLYQSITVPDGKIENATLEVYVTAQSNVKLKVGLMYSGAWIWSSAQWAPQSAQEIDYNITGTLANMAGKSVTLEVGALVDYSTANGDYSFMLKLDYVRLHVTWSENEEKKNTHHSSWSGGGTAWSGEHAYRWSRAGTLNDSYEAVLGSRIRDLLYIASSVVVAALWVRTGTDYFSSDPGRKARAKKEALDAFVGTVIIVAVLAGAAWLIARWVVGA